MKKLVSASELIGDNHPVDWSDYSDEGSDYRVRFKNALEEWPINDDAVAFMAALSEVTGDRRGARLMRTALKMRQARPKLDLDKMTEEWER
jgi:hypothetical protein